MRKSIIVGVLLTLLSMSILNSFNILPVKAIGTIYIRVDGSVDPPTAPIQRNGNVYTLTGNIISDADGIVVERDNIVINGAHFTVEGALALPSHGIYLYRRNNVTIQNTNIRQFGDGIWLNSSSNNSISGNNITSTDVGINLDSSSNNIISGNSMETNDWCNIRLAGSSSNNIWGNNITESNENGIFFHFSSNNSINGNNIANNRYSINLYSSSGNSITANNMTANNDGMTFTNLSNNTISGNVFVDDGILVGGPGNVVTGNKVNGKPLVYLEDVSDYIVENAGQVILVNCNRIRVENLNLSNTAVGIELLQTNNTLVSGNTITNNNYGIIISDSSNDSISGNIVALNQYVNIFLENSSSNMISKNYIGGLETPQGNYMSSVGIAATSSSNNTITQNNLTLCGCAIRFEGRSFLGEDASNNNITENTIQSSMSGFRLSHSSNNTLMRNTMRGPRYLPGQDVEGIDLYLCHFNMIAQNSITSYEEGVKLTDSIMNIITQNELKYNTFGVQLFGAHNTVSHNNIKGNVAGIYIESPYEYPVNSVYHNNFVDNERQVWDRTSDLNYTWDDGYPSGGNYWSDHNPPDIDKDKIGDLPYTLSENNTDRYPLIFPFECYEPGYVCGPDLNKDGVVNIVDVSKVARSFGCVPGDPDWTAVADMDLNEIINIIDVSKVAKDFGKTV